LSGANYTNVDENPPDGDTSYVSATTSGIRDSYGFGSPVQGINPLFVCVNCYAENPDAGAVSLQGLTYNGSTYGLGDSKPAPLSYQTVQFPIFRDPATSAAWTKAGINTAEFGVGGSDAGTARKSWSGNRNPGKGPVLKGKGASDPDGARFDGLWRDLHRGNAVTNVSTVYGEFFTLGGGGTAQASTVYTEVFSDGAHSARVSTVYGEFATQGAPSLRVSTVYVEVATYLPPDPTSLRSSWGRRTPSIFRPPDVIKVRSQKNTEPPSSTPPPQAGFAATGTLSAYAVNLSSLALNAQAAIFAALVYLKRTATGCILLRLKDGRRIVPQPATRR
jgi:hypothetical protein